MTKEPLQLIQNKVKNKQLGDIKKITKGASITLGGNMAGKALLFFYTIFLANVLGAEDLGLYFLGITIVKILTILALLGLDTGVVRYVSIYFGRNDLGRARGTVIAAGAISMAPAIVFISLAFLSSDFVACSVFHKPQLGPIIKLLSLAIPFEALLKIFLAATKGLKLMQYSAMIENLVWISFRFLFALFFTSLLGWNLKGVVIAYIISTFLAAGVAYFYANRLLNLFESKIAPIFENKKLLRFSIPMVLTRLVYELTSHIDIFILGLFVSSTAIGIYGVAVRIIMLAQVVFMAFQPMFQPLVAELHDKNEYARLANLLKVTTHWSLSISLPVFLTLLIYPTFFLQFFGEQYLSGANCLSLLVVAFAISAISNFPATIIFMTGKSHLSLINNVITLIINVILNFIFIPMFGMIGAALATGIAFICLCIIRILETYSLFQLHPLKLSMWKPLTAGLGALVITLFSNQIIALQGSLSKVITLPFFIVLYFTFLILMKFDEEQLQMLDLIKKRLSAFTK